MPRSDRIDVSDLLSVPYRRGGRDPSRGLDCYTTAAEAATRIPGLDSAPWNLGEIEALESLDAWTCLGREACLARELGDVVLTNSPGAPAGLGMLVDTGARLFVTSTPARGVHLVHARAFSDVVGVYRWEGGV